MRRGEVRKTSKKEGGRRGEKTKEEEYERMRKREEDMKKGRDKVES